MTPAHLKIHRIICTLTRFGRRFLSSNLRYYYFRFFNNHISIRVIRFIRVIRV